MDELKEKAKEQEFIETMYGRKVFLPNINHSNFQVRSGSERTAINAPIQGTAADILKLAMIKIKNWLDKEKISDVYMIMQVHDELVFDMHTSESSELKTLVKEKMVQAVSLQVPLIVDIGEGLNWLEVDTGYFGSFWSGVKVDNGQSLLLGMSGNLTLVTLALAPEVPPLRIIPVEI